MSSAISARKLKKYYRGKTAIDLSCDIEAGKIVGLIGKNGAGKTTFMKVCAGLLKPSEGDIMVLGKSPWKERARLGRELAFIPDMAALDGWMRVGGLLKFMENMHPNWNRDKSRELLRESGLPEDQTIRTLSRGMRVKLYLLMGLSVDSKLMILDEPTLGLDIPFRKAFFDTLLADYVDGARTILISTHEVDEVDGILEEVIFIDNGQIICKENVDALKSRFTLALLPKDDSFGDMGKSGYVVGSLMDKLLCLVEKAKMARLPLRDGSVEERSPKLSEIFIGFVEGGLR